MLSDRKRLRLGDGHASRDPRPDCAADGDAGLVADKLMDSGRFGTILCADPAHLPGAFPGTCAECPAATESPYSSGGWGPRLLVVLRRGVWLYSDRELVVNGLGEYL